MIRSGATILGIMARPPRTRTRPRRGPAGARRGSAGRLSLSDRPAAWSGTGARSTRGPRLYAPSLGIPHPSGRRRRSRHSHPRPEGRDLRPILIRRPAGRVTDHRLARFLLPLLRGCSHSSSVTVRKWGTAARIRLLCGFFRGTWQRRENYVRRIDRDTCFTGLTKCGECGSSFVGPSANRLVARHRRYLAANRGGCGGGI